MDALRKLFGPSQEEIWRQLSAEIGADYVEGGFWRSGKVQATHGPWIVTLDVYIVSTGKSTVSYTRMRSPYVNPDGFRFTVYRKGFFSEIGKWFGMQDIKVGDELFDNDFIVKSNSETKLQQLLSSVSIRHLISRQPEIHFTVKDDEGYFGPAFPEGADELCFMVVGVIKDVERLKLLYQLFSETLDRLCQMGSAYETDPHFAL